MCLQCRRLWFDSWVRKVCWRGDRLPTSVFLGFPCGSADEESACNVEDLGSIPGLGRSPGERNGYPSSILAWRIPWAEEPGGYNPWGHKESNTTKRRTLPLFTFIHHQSFTFHLSLFNWPPLTISPFSFPVPFWLPLLCFIFYILHMNEIKLHTWCLSFSTWFI